MLPDFTLEVQTTFPEYSPPFDDFLSLHDF